MKHPKKIRILAAAMTVLLSLGATVLAASYDSSEDPLISLSYLTNIFKPEIEKKYEERVKELEARLDLLDGGAVVKPAETEASSDDPVIDTRPDTETDGTGTEKDPVINTTTGDSASYEVIELTAGDALYAVSACDIMLRAGTAVCIAPDATQGIADYTDATEIYNGQSLVKNHMCLIPRGDGRGLTATSESVFIMIRGEYTIVEG